MAKRKIVRWLIAVVLVLLTLPVVAVGASTFVSRSRQFAVNETPGQSITYETSPELVAEGHRLFVSRGCGDCHGENGAGRVLMDAMPVAVVVPSNISNLGADYSIATFERALRSGIGADNQPLVFMPAHEYQFMRDIDVAAIYEHIRTLAPVTNELPLSSIGPVGRILHVTGMMPLFPSELVVPGARRPDPAPTVEYGSALAASCTGCHGANFSGGAIPGAPIELVGIPLNLTPHETGLAGMTYEQFVAAMQRGIKRDGTVMDTTKMPWANFASLNEVETQALWAFLQQVEPREFGNR
jgi:mono/diheme cytochrome c family protein